MEVIAGSINGVVFSDVAPTDGDIDVNPPTPTARPLPMRSAPPPTMPRPLQAAPAAAVTRGVDAAEARVPWTCSGEDGEDDEDAASRVAMAWVEAEEGSS